VFSHTHQNGVGPDLEKPSISLPIQVIDTVCKTNRSAHMIDPVSGRSDLSVCRLAGDIGENRPFGHLIRHPPGNPKKSVEHRLHLKRMECMGYLQGNGGNLLKLQLLSQFPDIFLMPGHDDISGAVECGDFQLAGIGCNGCGHLPGVGQNRQHPAGFRQCLNQLPAGDNQHEGVFETEHLCQACGHIFAHTVTHHRRRLDPPGLPHFRQCILQREQSRLSVCRIVDTELRRRCRKQQIDQRHPKQRRQNVSASVDPHSKFRLLVVEPSAHSRILGTLTRKQENDTGPGCLYFALITTGRRGRPGLLRQQAGECLGGTGDSRHAVGKVRSTRGGRITDIGQIHIRVRCQILPITLSEFGQGFRGSGGQRQHVNRSVHLLRRDRSLKIVSVLPILPLTVCRSFLDDDMGIGAADAECADTGSSGTAGMDRPGQGPIGDLDKHLVPGNVRRRGAEHQMSRNPVVLKGQNDLDDPGNPRSRFKMVDIGFDRPDPQRPIRRPVRAQHCSQGIDFHRVPKQRAGSMGFHIIHRKRIDTCLLHGLKQKRLLCLAVGSGDPAAGTVVIDRRAPDDGQYPFSPIHGFGQPTQHDNPAPFPPAVSVGRGIECFAAAVGRQDFDAGEKNPGFRLQHHLNPACERQIAFPGLKTLACLVQRNQ